MTNKPGFYVAKVRGVEVVRGVLRSDGWFIAPELVGGLYSHTPKNFTDLRPLWTADPESDEDRLDLEVAWQDNATVRDVLRALANPEPPPVEPNGVGAYVETADGGYTLGVDGNWRNEDGFIHQGYPRDPMGPAPLVYSHGYGCTCGGPDCPGGAS